MNGQVWIILFFIGELIISGCKNCQEQNMTPAISNEASHNTKTDYQKAMTNFGEWRDFIKYTIDEVTILSMDEEYIDEYSEAKGKMVKVKNISYFKPVNIKDPAIISELVCGIKKAQYYIIYDENNTAFAFESPWAKIIFKSEKNEKIIWVLSFGYSSIGEASIPYLFSSRPLTSALKKIFKNTVQYDSLDWGEMSTGDWK